MAQIRWISALVLGTAVGACTLPPPKDHLGYIDLNNARSATGQQFQVLESGVVSPEVQLSREDGVLRGWVAREPIEMRVEGNMIKGARGSQPIELRVSREGTAIVARGMYGGRLADLAICAPASDAPAPPGQVEAFSGERSCFPGNPATIARMLKKLGDTEAMAMLVSIYGR